MEVCKDAAQLPQLFVNDDACGDWVFRFDSGLELQVMNVVSSLCFFLVGARLIFGAYEPITRAYGAMFCCVGLGACSFHGTTLLSSFLVDICPMAVTGALMLFRAIHALQADLGRAAGPGAETARYIASMLAAFFAVYVPWTLIAAGVSHSTVWWVWAFGFGSMGAAFGVVAFLTFTSEGLLHGERLADLVIAVGSILLGLAITAHSFIPGLCSGWRRQLPLHAVWHLAGAVTAHRCGRLLDALTKLVEEMENRPQKRKDKSLLVRLLERDLLPSQFSM